MKKNIQLEPASGKAKVVFLKDFEGQFNKIRFKQKLGSSLEVDGGIIPYLLKHKAINSDRD